MISLWKNEFLQELSPYLNLTSTKDLTGRATSTGGRGGRDLTSDGDFSSLEGKREGRRDSADTSKRQLTPPFGMRTETGWLSEWMNDLHNTESVRDCKKVCSSFSCSAVRDPVCTDAMSQTYSEKSKKIRNCRARLVRTKDFASWDSIHIFNSLSF